MDCIQIMKNNTIRKYIIKPVLFDFNLKFIFFSQKLNLNVKNEND